MEKLKGKFWTNENEMIEEIEELGFEVLDINYECVTLSEIDRRYEDEEFDVELIRAGRTIAIA